MRRPPPPGRSRGRLVSWPLYRLLLAVALAALLLAVLLVQQIDLPGQPSQVLTFSGDRAANQAAQFLSLKGGRAPGEPGSEAAADLVARRLTRAGYQVTDRPFAADLLGRANVPMRNVIAVQPGTSSEYLAVIAHHDGIGQGADDNASSLGVMIELAQELAGETRTRGVVFVATDGGTTGGQGAAEFARTWPDADKIAAAIVLDAVSAPPGTPLRILIRPESPIGTSPHLYASTRRAILRYTGNAPLTPGWFDQVSGYAIPYVRTEQGPLLARGVPAVTITAGDPASAADTFESLRAGQLGSVGLTMRNLLAELDAAPSIDRGGPPSVFLGGKELRGRLAQIAIVLLMVPPLACFLDAAAGSRRRRIPLRRGMAALGWRFSTWLVGLVCLWLLPLMPGDLASGVDVAPPPGSTGLSLGGLALVAVVVAGYWWWVPRARLLRRGPVTGVDRTGGLVTGWLGLGFAALLLCAVNPFAVLLLLPAGHAWLWLPWAARGGPRAMLLVLALGLTGLLLFLIELGSAQHLGWSAPRAVLAMTASGYLSPAVTVCLAGAGAAMTQLGSLALGRYAPARPARGSRV
ncbi:MAG TPA: M28 family peptidase [Gaiellales bacterium]|nr:M28 family peptidase [Gaiellales bacterium]